MGDTISGKTLTDLLFGPALNSHDSAALVGPFPGGTPGVHQQALLVQSGDTTGGEKLTTFGLPVISDNGTVAFFGTYPRGAGIFTQSSLIARTGDTLCGRTLVGLGPAAINSAGDIVLRNSSRNIQRISLIPPRPPAY